MLSGKTILRFFFTLQAFALRGVCIVWCLVCIILGIPQLDKEVFQCCHLRRPPDASYMMLAQGDAAAPNFWEALQGHLDLGCPEVAIPLVAQIAHGSQCLEHCVCFNCVIAKQLSLDCNCTKCILSKLLGKPKPDDV